MLGTRRRIALIAIALCVTGRSVAQSQPDGGCAAARAAWLGGQFAEAEREARVCLQARPNDTQVWFELSRALAGQGRYAEALQWSRRALARHPDDMDWLAHHMRVTAWSGDLDGAWALVDDLSAAAFDDPATARLVADLAFWRAQYADAARRYSTWLERFGDDGDVYRNRSVAYLELDQPGRALDDARAACSHVPSHCAYYDDVRKRLSPYDMHAETAVTDTNTGPGWLDITVGAGRRFSSGLRVGVFVDVQDRFGAEGTTALVVEAGATVPLPGRWLVSARGGAGLLDSPLAWTAQVEPGRAFSFGLEVYLKIWHLAFDNGPVTIVSPAVFYTRPSYELRARHFASRKDTTGITHAVIGEAHYTGWQKYRFLVTGGGGQSADVDDVLGDGLIEGFWELGAGATRELGWRHKISVRYVWRSGTVAVGELQPVDRTFRRQRVMLLYQLQL